MVRNKSGIGVNMKRKRERDIKGNNEEAREVEMERAGKLG